MPIHNLYHLRLGNKVAVDLLPAPTAAGRSTVAWPTAIKDPASSAAAITLSASSSSSSNDPTVNSGCDGGVPSSEEIPYDPPREAVAGAALEIVVEARDAFGNARGVGE